MWGGMFELVNMEKCAQRLNWVLTCVCLGDTRALCDDMKDFAHDYIDYSNMAKQLIPETNPVQHWSKMIETKYVLCVLVVSRPSSLFFFERTVDKPSNNTLIFSQEPPGGYEKMFQGPGQQRRV